jgi:hypothetical protein
MIRSPGIGRSTKQWHIYPLSPLIGGEGHGEHSAVTSCYQAALHLKKKRW